MVIGRGGEEYGKWQIGRAWSGRVDEDVGAGVCDWCPELIGFCLGMSKALTFCGVLRGDVGGLLDVKWRVGKTVPSGGKVRRRGGKVIIFGETFEHLETGCFLLGFWARCAR